MPNQYKPLLTILLAALAFYALNKLLFLLPDMAFYYTSYHYSIETLFLFFTISSLIITLIIIKVHQNLPDSTGYSFIAGTTIKMGVAYFIMRPILKSGEGGDSFEKFNFFALFILFLATETVVTIRLLNKKQ